jgi:hypothetical protein
MTELLSNFFGKLNSAIAAYDEERANLANSPGARGEAAVSMAVLGEAGPEAAARG